MASIIAVSEALAARAAPVLPDWNTLWFEPSPIPVPALCVRPDPAKFADYQQVWGRFTKWHLRVALYLSANDQESARLMMGQLTDPKGDLIRALTHNDDTDDVLASVEVTFGRGWDVIRRNRQRYLYADLSVVCGAN